jgi:hypothetical protein
MIRDFVSLTGAREAMDSIRRAVMWAGTVAVSVAGTAGMFGGAYLLLQPDKKVLEITAAMADGSSSCNASDPLETARIMFLMLLMAGVWAEWWSNAKLKAWRAARAERRGKVG